MSRIVANIVVPGPIPEENATARRIREGILRRSIHVPQAAGIGPFNPFFSSERAVATGKLKQTQYDKRACLRNLLPRDDFSRSRQACFAAMKNLEGRIRASYSDEITMRSDDLANAMLLDGFFILDLLLNHSQDTRLSSDDFLLRYDLLFVENQIPFFVVVHLLKLLRNNCEPLSFNEPHDLDEHGKYLAGCGLRLFESIHPDRDRVDASILAASFRQVRHLLHLFYQSIPESSKPSKSSRKAPLWIPNAKKLHDDGVEFKKRTDASSFLDIKFSKGVLEIPPLELHDHNNSLFRNLIAFEQCYPETDFRVTIYAAFMDCLLKTPEDTKLLRLRGILTNRMATDQDAYRFFSSLCDQVRYETDKSYLRDLCLDVNKYGKSMWRMLGDVVRFSNHFNK